jgi:serine protease AprX
MNTAKTAFPVLLLLTSSVVLGQKLSSDLAGLNASQQVDVIVRYNSAATAQQQQKVTSGGGVVKAKHDLIHSVSYRIGAAQLADLAKDPDVVHVSVDHPIKALVDETTGVIGGSFASTIAIDYFRETANHGPVGFPSYNANGIVIALIDSGITVNADLSQTVLYQQSFVPGDSSTADAYGHGTHVAGMLVGSGKNSSGVNSKYQFGGEAPGASLINLRVLDVNGSGSDSSVISAIERAIALNSTYNIGVINLSLGRPPAESYVNDPLCQAVEAAWNAGIVVVVAAGNEGRNNTAGNEGYGTILAPGNDPYVITVGAMKSMGTTTRNDDLIASYSSKGPTLIDHVVKPDLVAPGNLVISVLAPNSTLANAYPANLVPPSVYSNGTVTPLASGIGTSASSAYKYFVLSGTSMSTPVVSAAAAALLDKNGSLTPDQIKARLMKTASKSFPVSSVAVDPTTGISYTSYYDIFTVGAGYLDVGAALVNNDLAPGSAMSPTVSYNTATKTATLNVSGSSVIWGTSLIWGDSVIWGTSVFVGGSSVIWGTGVSWGEATPSGLSVIWGTTTASASSVIWGTSIPSAAALIRGE